MNTYTVILVEDEHLARKRLVKMLQPYLDFISLIGEAKNGEEGFVLINELKPDFVFLDIKMPLLNGFDMLLKLDHNPYIIFTTAFDEYAIQAFENNSIDYLLKPIREERLAITIEKMKNIKSNTPSEVVDLTQLQHLISQMNQPKTIKSITVHLGERMLIIRLEDIVLFQAEDKYVTVYTRQGESHLISQSLSQLEQKLPEHFLRINRSSIINEYEIKEIQKGFNRKWVFIMHHISNENLVSGSNYLQNIKAYLKF